MANLLTLEILTGYTRPVVSLKTHISNNATEGKDAQASNGSGTKEEIETTNHKDNVTCLIDSGADTPVWTQGEERLLRAYKAEKIQGKKFILSGFGTGYEVADVYKVHDIELRDENSGDKIVFKNITFACVSRPTMVADFILPNTAFSHMNLMIRNLDVESPIIEIEHRKTEYFVNPIYRTDDDRLVDRVYSFANE